MSKTYKHSYRVYCKASPNYSLAAGRGMAILSPMDEKDERQHWYKDDRCNYKKDNWGFPAFSLVNKATGQTLKHSFDHPAPVKLITCDPDDSVLWALAEDRCEGYKSIRNLNCQSHLEAAALNDCSYHGAIIMAGIWNNGNNQLWKIEPI